MKTPNFILFLVPSFIWGSTWYAIKFQLGVVHPVLSVAYRFAIAGILLLLVTRLLNQNMKFTIKQHLLIALQGFCLFSTNYCLIYYAEQFLTSGLVAVFFSLIIFANIIFSSVFLKIKISIPVVIGAISGITGTVLLYYQEIIHIGLTREIFMAIILCLSSVVLASLGNIISAFNQKNNIPVLQTNAYGMTYGSLVLFLVTPFVGIEYSFDIGTPYVLSLLYLAIFGSVIAFTSYLNLLGRIGPDKSAYAVLLIPIIALIISSLFEDLKWHISAIFGIVLLLAGNLIAMNDKKILLKFNNNKKK